MESYSTYESVRPHFEALASVGYFKIVMKDVSRSKRFLHNCYRGLVLIAVLLYILQHITSVVQARHSTDKMVDTLFILLTVLSTFGKQAAFNVRGGRVEQLLTVVNGPEFAATTPHGLGIMKASARSMRRLLAAYQICVYACGSLWGIIPLIDRALGKEVKFTGYIPFNTQNKFIFIPVILYMSSSITLQGIGNVSTDCAIASLFALAKVQVQMLRHNLEHLADEQIDSCNLDQLAEEKSCLEGGDRMRRRNLVHLDEQTDRTCLEDRSAVLQWRLAKCVKHYKQIKWFSKEAESIFSEALAFLFLVSALVICMTVYKAVGMDRVSAEFVSMMIFLAVILAQLFTYCYYGTQYHTESECISQSIYCSDWVSLRPAFRRQLLILMTHCGRPTVPMVARVVPMTMDTFITILKSSYSLFTLLDKRQTA